MEDLITAFLEYYQVERNAKPGTLVRYGECMKKFARWMGDMQAEEVTASDINRFIFELKAGGASINYQRVHQVAVRMFFRWYTEKVDPDLPNPAAGVKQIHEDVKVPKVPTPTDVARLITNCDMSTFMGRRDAALISLLADTGIRRSECEQLRVGNVQVAADHLVLTVPRTKSFERSVPFCKFREGSMVSEYFLAYWQEVTIVKSWGNNHPLFMTDGVLIAGTPLRSGGIWVALRAAAKRAGIPPIAPHAFRHFYGTYSYLNGTDIRDLKYLMGHALIETTLRYVHVANVIEGTVLKKTATAGLKSPMEVTGYVKLFKKSQEAKR